MFTGIVTDVGMVRRVERRGDLRLEIRTGYDLATVDLGASIACSGVCLTVVDKGPEENGCWFAVDVSGETQSRTAKDLWREGARLNLERSLRLGDELGGHIVTGHVDNVADVVAARNQGGSTHLMLSTPAQVGRALAPKGSVALDGVSLTINEVEDMGERTRFTLNVIPHTAQQTTLGDVQVGRQLNVEVDVLARYIERMLAARAQ